jgi:hypothetical protein
MTHTERRLNRALEEWLVEVVHADPTASDETVLAEIRLRIDAKIAATFRKRFPKVMDPCRIHRRS